MTSLPTFFDTQLHPYTTQDIRADATTARQTCTYVQHVWTQKWGRRHPLYSLTDVSHRNHTAFLHTRLMRLRLPAYPATTTASSFHQRRCNLHTHPSCPPHTHPCPSPGDLLHAITECPHLLTHLQHTFPSYRPPTLKIFFSNPHLPQLASQTQHIYDYVMRSPQPTPLVGEDT
jgi:hypothetical protein